MWRVVEAGLLVLLAVGTPAPQQRTEPRSEPDVEAAITSPLDGNWQITGDRARNVYPVLSMALYVDGNRVTAVGAGMLYCQESSRRSAGGTLGLEGELDPEGNFTLRTRSPRNTLQLTIHGRVPTAGARNWRGSYSVTGSTGPGCTLDQTGGFSATPLVPLRGSFGGKVAVVDASGASFNGSATGVTLLVSVAQGPFLTHTRRVGPAATRLPLTATVDVSGSPCFAHGATDGSLHNVVEGDATHLRFLMEDGSELTFSSVFTDPTEAGLTLQLAEVRGGRCDKQQFAGALERQAPSQGRADAEDRTDDVARLTASSSAACSSGWSTAASLPSVRTCAGQLRRTREKGLGIRK